MPLDDRLASLVQMHRDGALDDGEFAAAKSSLLAEAGDGSLLRSRRVLIASGVVVVVLLAGVAAFAATRSGDGRDAARCEALRISAGAAPSRAAANAQMERGGCLWYVRQFEDTLAAGDPSAPADQVSPPPSATRYADEFEAYTAEIRTAAVVQSWSTADDFTAAAEDVCGRPIDDMTAWMRQQIQGGLWAIDDVQAHLLNYGSLIRQVCPQSTVAFGEAGSAVIFGGAEGDDTSEMPSEVKAALLEECLSEAKKQTDDVVRLSMLDACRTYS